jgi:sigma-B regulation protein RsbU (phosphoserine phosphatase)
VVGLFPDVRYEQERITLAENDLLVGFTDGVSEAMNQGEQEWGEERMIESLKKCGGQSASEIVKNLVAAADQFANGSPQHDDMTVVALKVLAG